MLFASGRGVYALQDYTNNIDIAGSANSVQLTDSQGDELDQFKATIHDPLSTFIIQNEDDFIALNEWDPNGWPTCNLLTNGDFEGVFTTVASSWSSSTNKTTGTVTYASSNTARFGSTAQSITISNINNNAFANVSQKVTLPVDGNLAPINALPYVLSCWYFVTAALQNTNIQLLVNWNDVNGSFMSTSTRLILPNLPASSSWQRASIQVTAPAGAYSGNVILQLITTNSVNGGTVLFDGAQFEYCTFANVRSIGYSPSLIGVPIFTYTGPSAGSPQFAIYDPATGSDLLTGVWPNERGTGTDVISLSATLAMTDTASGTDTISVLNTSAPPVPDSGAALELLSVQATNGPLYFTQATSSTLGAPGAQMVLTGGGTSASASSVVGGQTGWVELYGQGSVSQVSAATAIGTPSGKGYLYDTTALEGQQIASGVWTPQVKLAVNDTSTLTVNVMARFYKRSSSGVYTLIAQSQVTSVALTSTPTTLTLPTVWTTSATQFGTGDKLYADIWVNIVNTALATSTTALVHGDVPSTASGVTGGGSNAITPPISSGISQPVTPLILYTAQAASGTLSTARTLVKNYGNTGTSSSTTLIGTSTGYGEIYSQGNASAWPAAGGVSAPSGHGILYDSTALEGLQLVAGTWGQTFRFALSVGTATANLIGRWYVRHSNGTYTAIGTSTLTAQSLTTTFTTYTLPGVSLSAVSFATGDKLYLDFWLDITANTTGSGSATVTWGDFGFTPAGAGGNGNTTTTPGYHPIPSPVPAPLWQVACIDTMKESRDTCNHPITTAQIADHIAVAASLGVTHITVDCFYDYPDYMAQWVAAVRAVGKSVWFRGHWNQWEGNNGATGIQTPTSYISQTVTFLQTNPGLFQPGDIIDACSEPENGLYWESTYGVHWSWLGAPNSGTNDFNTFEVNLHNNVLTTLANMGITGITELRSHNSWWLQHPSSLYPSTVSTIGYVVPDSYPEQTNTDPATCANLRVAELTAMHTAFPNQPIIIGELGYNINVSVTDANQQATLQAEMNAITALPYVVGMNYWVGAGVDRNNDTSRLFAGDRGYWTLRPAAQVLKTTYIQQTSILNPTPTESGAGAEAVTLGTVAVGVKQDTATGTEGVSFPGGGGAAPTGATYPIVDGWNATGIGPGVSFNIGTAPSGSSGPAHAATQWVGLGNAPASASARGISQGNVALYPMAIYTVSVQYQLQASLAGGASAVVGVTYFDSHGNPLGSAQATGPQNEVVSGLWETLTLTIGPGTVNPIPTGTVTVNVFAGLYAPTGAASGVIALAQLVFAALPPWQQYYAGVGQTALAAGLYPAPFAGAGQPGCYQDKGLSGCWYRQLRWFGGFVKTCETDYDDLGGWEGNIQVTATDYGALLDEAPATLIIVNQQDYQAIKAACDYASQQGYLQGLDYTTYVTNIAPIDNFIVSWETTRFVLNKIADQTVAAYYVDPYKFLHYGPALATSAPYGLSDHPDYVSTFPMSKLQITRDSTQNVSTTVIEGSTQLSSPQTYSDTAQSTTLSGVSATLSGNIAAGVSSLPVTSGGTSFTNGMVIVIGAGTANQETLTVASGATSTSVPLTSTTTNSHSSGDLVGQRVLASGTAYTSLSVAALTHAVTAGTYFQVGAATAVSVLQVDCANGANNGATSLPINSVQASRDVAAGEPVATIGWTVYLTNPIVQVDSAQVGATQAVIGLSNTNTYAQGYTALLTPETGVIIWQNPQTSGAVTIVYRFNTPVLVRIRNTITEAPTGKTRRRIHHHHKIDTISSQKSAIDRANAELTQHTKELPIGKATINSPPWPVGTILQAGMAIPITFGPARLTGALYQITKATIVPRAFGGVQYQLELGFYIPTFMLYAHQVNRALNRADITPGTVLQDVLSATDGWVYTDSVSAVPNNEGIWGGGPTAALALVDYGVTTEQISVSGGPGPAGSSSSYQSTWGGTFVWG